MAQSRLEKIGTIFTRTTGLLRSGAIKSEEKPIWYDVYAAFTPKLEPRYDRPAPNVPIRDIFYKEDESRAKFQKSNKDLELVNLGDNKRETQTQQFIKIYQGLVDQGALDEEQVFNTAKQLLAEQRIKTRSDTILQTQEAHKTQDDVNTSSNLVTEFNEATKNKESRSQAEKSKTNNQSIDIQNLFKD